MPLRFTALTLNIVLASMVLSGCGQSHEEPANHWQKINARGAPLGIDEGPWACVHDHATGLTWESKSDNEGRHYAGSTYYWNMATPKYDGGCMFEPGHASACDIDMQIHHLNSLNRCGIDDWRLPTLSELKSLLYDTGFPGGKAKTITGFFPHTGREAYWSADTSIDKRGREAARILHFGTGETHWLPLSQVARVRLVHGPVIAE